jgi:hypothetical protein
MTVSTASGTSKPSLLSVAIVEELRHQPLLLPVAIVEELRHQPLLLPVAIVEELRLSLNSSMIVYRG